MKRFRGSEGNKKWSLKKKKEPNLKEPFNIGMNFTFILRTIGIHTKGF